MRLYKYVILLGVFSSNATWAQIIGEKTIDVISRNIQQQAKAMGQTFIKGDYHAFAGYTYPPIIKAMGGEQRMTELLKTSMEGMHAQGVFLNSIIFDHLSNIVKDHDELQCTLQQHTEAKVLNGRVLSTTTLIAFSKDGGKKWFFVDTSNKDITTMRKVLPNLNAAIVIPAPQKPVFYKN